MRIHDSARNQMPEPFLNPIGPKFFETHRAGFEPASLNPVMVEVMGEAAIGISWNRTKSVSEILRWGWGCSRVITVWDEASVERSSVYRGRVGGLHWGFRGPAASQGAGDDRLTRVHDMRDAIPRHNQQWFDELCADPESAPIHASY